MRQVVKLGGSLLAAGTIAACLEAIERCDAQTVIVPGGGVFADQVRLAQQQHGFDDRAAHAMALLAMQQMAWLLHSVKPTFSMVNGFNGWPADKVVIAVPCLQDLDVAGVPASWAVTSDSLAAFVACQLAADRLCLVKSAAVDSEDSVALWQQHGWVDDAFAEAIADFDGKVSVVHYLDFIQGKIV
jgi:aspartokinase-like uncharacterized kinase